MSGFITLRSIANAALSSQVGCMTLTKDYLPVACHF